MKVLILCFASFIFWSQLASGQHAVPPGLRKADKLPNPADVPPQVNADSQSRPRDAAQLKRHADELRRLAQSLPPDIEQASRGRLPRDLNEKLKRIEKLSKQLRRELSL